MLEEKKFYNSSEKSISTGLKFLIVEIIVLVVFIVGIFIALSYFGVFNVFNLFNSFPESEQKVVAEDKNQQNREENLIIENVAPITFNDQYVEDVEIKYTLRGEVLNIVESETEYLISYDHDSLPPFPVSKTSWVSKDLDNGQRVPIRISEVKIGDIITFSPRYNLTTKEWVLYHAVPAEDESPDLDISGSVKDE